MTGIRDIGSITKSISLNVSQKKYYLFQRKPMPCELDNDINDLITLFMQASHSDRENILKKVDSIIAGVLTGFGYRMAVWGIRHQSRDFLLRGLISLVMAGDNYDYRDIIQIMPLLYHSAVRIGVDPQVLFDEAAAYYPNSIARLLNDFPRRSPERRGLEAFYYKEVNTPDGIDYRIG